MAAGDLLILLFQTLVIVVAATLTFLAGRSHRPFIPIADSPPFVAYRDRYPRRQQMAAVVPAVAAE